LFTLAQRGPFAPDGIVAAIVTQWCNARAGWDGPTGLGTPNGTGAF
jgi:hypothetical protein